MARFVTLPVRDGVLSSGTMCVLPTRDGASSSVPICVQDGVANSGPIRYVAGASWSVK